MTALEKYFFTPIYYPHSAISVIKWWESRRLVFNAAVGATGAASMTVLTLLSLLPPHPHPLQVPFIGIAVYGVLANVCYSLGAPADLLLRRWLGDDRAAAAGPALFRYGFVFSLGLTLLPIPVAALDWLVRLFFR